MSGRTFRIAPWWWPGLAVAAPVLAPLLALRYRRFRRDRDRAAQVNRERLERAGPLELPPLERLDLTVVVEARSEPGFLGEAGVSYLLRSERGALLLDVGFGKDRPALRHNAARLGLGLDQVDGLCISHLHLDHMGGLAAQRSGQVLVPGFLGEPQEKPCALPDRAEFQVATGKRRIRPAIASRIMTGLRLRKPGVKPRRDPLQQKHRHFLWSYD